ncbi:MAG: hypothetical protein VW835_22655 [Rickettsiales bacterium]
MLDPQVFARAEQAVEPFSDDFATWAQEDIVKLRKAVERDQAGDLAPDDTIAAIYKGALELKGQGGAFGYDFVTAIGDLLNRCVEDWTTIFAPDFQIIEAHIDALQAVIRDEIKGSKDKVGANIVKGLHVFVEQRSA